MTNYNIFFWLYVLTNHNVGFIVNFIISLTLLFHYIYYVKVRVHVTSILRTLVKIFKGVWLISTVRTLVNELF